MNVLAALEMVRNSPSILDAMRRTDALVAAARLDSTPGTVHLVATAARSTDQVSAIAAVHALGHLRHPSAGAMLVGLLTDESLFLREHAAWALGARRPQPDGFEPLADLVAAGGFTGMLAQRTLERWRAMASEPMARTIERALADAADPDARARLVETAGRLHGATAERILRQVALDTDEGLPARAAAVEALGDRRPHESIRSVARRLAAEAGPLGDVARLALADLGATASPRRRERRGLAIAQVFLHADIDHDLTHVGAGDNGGIATVLVRLGDALVAHGVDGGDPDAATAGGVRQVERVVTISRGGYGEALGDWGRIAPTHTGHTFATVPFLHPPIPAAQAWPRRVAVERGLRRVLRAAGPVDAIHLRMTDVGTLAAAAVARDLGIPVVFTVAPDPHAVIESLETSGALTRERFGAADEQEHFWFRVHLAQRVAADAAHLVFFPRPQLEADMGRLLGIDLAAHPDQHTVLAEGIDLDIVDRALTEARAPAEPPAEPPTGPAAGPAARPPAAMSPHAPAAPPSDIAGEAFADLDALLVQLPPHRRGLPLAVTVGRLHPVKGMATLVGAWAGNPLLRDRCNLLVIGGDLENPSPDEQDQLGRIAAVAPLAHAPSRGLLLAGHRTNSTVAHWLAAARYGRPGLAAPGGVYVCASIKEEFGIALLEAMATGLLVVAPASGGPATYVENAVTGFLVDTRDTTALAQGVLDAVDLTAGATGPAGAARAQQVVSSRFAIEGMAASLVTVYAQVAAAHDSRVARRAVS